MIRQPGYGNQDACIKTAGGQKAPGTYLFDSRRAIKSCFLLIWSINLMLITSKITWNRKEKKSQHKENISRCFSPTYIYIYKNHIPKTLRFQTVYPSTTRMQASARKRKLEGKAVNEKVKVQVGRGAQLVLSSSVPDNKIIS